MNPKWTKANKRMVSVPDVKPSKQTPSPPNVLDLTVSIEDAAFGKPKKVINPKVSR